MYLRAWTRMPPASRSTGLGVAFPPPTPDPEAQPTRRTPDRSGWADSCQDWRSALGAATYDGEVHTRVIRHPDQDTPHDVEVTRADPRIKVSGQLMDEARAGTTRTMQTTTHRDTELLTITASNGAWVYVVAHYDSGRDVYLCHWPD